MLILHGNSMILARRLILLTGFALLLSGQNCLAMRGVIMVLGVDQEEAIQLSVPGTGDECLQDRIGVLNVVLREHPQNRGALIVRAQAEIELGLIGGAGLDLAVLKSIDPSFPNLDFTQALLAHAKGANEEELAAYLAMHTDDPGERARILELQGHPDDAIGLLTEATTDNSDILRGDHLTDLSDLELRHGRRADAIRDYKAAIVEMRDVKRGFTQESGCALAQMKLMGVQWANGQREEALRLALAVSRTVIEDKKYYYARPCVARSVLAALALTKEGVGSPQDRAEAEELLAKALKFVEKDHAEMDERYLLAIAGKLDRKEVLSKFDGVLKRAPNLEWAQWGVLYLSLEAGDVKESSSGLPNDCLPGQIILEEDKLANVLRKHSTSISPVIGDGGRHWLPKARDENAP
ncbi:MAG TPA: hypothetical protein VFE47_32110 [Tepidisphaeraceae bacterium]|nr:hypothetical protein [Tepidisphaeraceae bacterium]